MFDTIVWHGTIKQSVEFFLLLANLTNFFRFVCNFHCSSSSNSPVIDGMLVFNNLKNEWKDFKHPKAKSTVIFEMPVERRATRRDDSTSTVFTCLLDFGYFSS